MTGTILALAGYGVVLIISEYCYRFFNGYLLSRKIAHIGSGIVTAALPFLVELETALFFSALFTLLLLVSQRYRLIQSVYEYKDGLGSLCFPIGMGIAAFLFWGTPEVFSGAAILFALPDGVAGYVGKKLGRHKYSITGTKTIEGSVAFFVSALIVFLIWALFFDLSLDIRLLISGVGVTILLAAVEGALGRGIDNLFLPVIAGALLTLLI